MSLNQRYTQIFRGALTYTGNTLGFGGVIGAGISAFLATIPGLSVPTFPTPSTSNWQQNGSTAVLTIPVGSTIEYAELIWGGSARDDAVTLPNSTLDTPITFVTPTGSNTVTRDPATSASSDLLGLQIFYTRSQNVTTIVKAAGPGTYAVGGVPGTLNPSPGATSACGWTLAVAYSNPSLPRTSLNIYIGNFAISNGAPPVNTTLSGFFTPSSGPVSTRVLSTAMEGNQGSGDTLALGPVSLASFVTLSGPNNPLTNFFCSQINNDQGLIDTSGSFGNLNCTPGVYTPFQRASWDITNVNGSSAFTNSQRQIVARIATVGDAFAVSSIGLGVLVEAANFNITKSVDKQNAKPGDTLTYTIAFSNIGTTIANNIVLRDTIPTSTTYVPLSTTSSVTIVGGNPQSGITLSNSVAPSETVTISYQVLIQSTLPNPSTIVNIANLEYQFLSDPSLPAISDTQVSNTIITNVNQAILNSSKTSSPNYIALGETLTYTIIINNSGNTTATNITFIDTIPIGTTFVSGSLKQNGVTIPSSPNPPGASLSNIAPNTTSTITFNTYVYTIPNSNTISNTATTLFEYVVDPSTTPNTTGSGSSNTNVAYTSINSADLSSITKQANKNYAICSDTITYTIIVPNTGNTTAINVFLVDTIPNSTSFIDNSVYVNGLNRPGYNPSTGITIPDIARGSNATITFDVQINC